jgi:hypothetical protein
MAFRQPKVFSLLSILSKISKNSEKLEHKLTAKAARVFIEFDYQTHESWSRARRVVARHNRDLIW